MAIVRPKKSKPSAWSFIRAPAPLKANAHPIPPLGYILIALVVIQWFHATSLAVKLQCLIGAGLFSCTEYTFYTMTVESPDGTVSVKPFAGRPGHTTVHQYIMNVFYIPILIHGYHALIGSTALRILLFPINIWLLEVIQGYTLIYLIGYNAAWTYRGYDAFFHGTIKMSYVHHWLMMGAVLELVVLPYTLPLTETIATYLPF
ncbi:hypothetical protein BGZ96_006737 [Linnemannia gamsii]|uniref:Fatty acid hydroxylase domain-containing protein n=1 Tax=Linnemannia gamsii TaxID=64522 RepID=A0ABQ7KFS9_9FUNG|nr:hypothetical protein BGZ96_006737 [Linnemannia gamsii]